mgnify:CR=1 FL=1
MLRRLILAWKHTSNMRGQRRDEPVANRGTGCPHGETRGGALQSIRASGVIRHYLEADETVVAARSRWSRAALARQRPTGAQIRW